MKRIYLDHAATTPVRDEVLRAMKPYASEKFGNASSLHSLGQEAREAVETSRATIAKLTGAKPEEIIFTSSGTESNNTLIKGLALKRGKGHIITSAIEHPCVLNTCLWLQSRGTKVTFLPVDNYGLVSIEGFEEAIRKDTILATIMTANNEIGTIQPIRELHKIANEHSVPLHTDAVQAFGKIAVPETDAMTASAHKLYGPKGVGLLINRGLEFEPLMHGGGQESGLRSSTENVAGIVGFAKAAELAFKEQEREAKRQSALRDRLISSLLELPNTHLNGHARHRLPNNANIRFDYIEGEALVLALDEAGIAASTGSACSQRDLHASHVLLALGLAPHEVHGSLRMTLGRTTTEKDIGSALRTIPKEVAKLRKLSPFKDRYEGMERRH